MARWTSAGLQPFACYECGRVLGYTTAGEAKRINLRAHVFCEEHRNIPDDLTDRQATFISTARALRTAGHSPTFAMISEAMGISRSRGQQIVAGIRARGFAEELEDAMGLEIDREPPERKVFVSAGASFSDAGDESHQSDINPGALGHEFVV